MTNKEFIESVTLPGEEWRDVVGYDGYYMVSNLGRVASFHRAMHPVLLKSNPKAGSYCKVTIRKDGVVKTFQVHQLVAISFIPNPHNYRSIDHIDGDKRNNNISNLRWCTDSQNQNNPITRIKQRTTLKQKFSKFAPVKIVGIKPDDSIIIYETMCEASRDGFSQAMISECCNGHRKHHRGLRWIKLSDYEKLINKSKNS